MAENAAPVVTPKQAVLEAAKAMMAINEAMGNPRLEGVTIQTGAAPMGAAPQAPCPPGEKGAPYVAFIKGDSTSITNPILKELDLFTDNSKISTATSVFAAVTAPPEREEVAGFFATTQATTVRMLIGKRYAKNVKTVLEELTSKTPKPELTPVVQLYKDFISSMNLKLGEIDEKITDTPEFKKIKPALLLKTITREQYNAVIDLIRAHYSDLLDKANAVDKAYFDAMYVSRTEIAGAARNRNTAQAALAAMERERNARPTVEALADMQAELNARPTAKALATMQAERNARPKAEALATMQAELNARPKAEALATMQAERNAAKAKATSLRGFLNKPGLLGDTIAKLFPATNGDLKATLRTAIATAATVINITDADIDGLIVYINSMNAPAKEQLVSNLRLHSASPADIQRILNELIAVAAAVATLGGVISAELPNSTLAEKITLTTRINNALQRSVLERPYVDERRENFLIDWFNSRSARTKSVIANSYKQVDDDALYEYIHDELRGEGGAQAGGRRRRVRFQTRKGRGQRRRHVTRRG